MSETRPSSSHQAETWLYKQIYNLIFAVVLLAAITSLGTLGYVLIEGWSFDDALFMTVITLSTVGYTIVKPLTIQGQYFTIFLIISALSVALYCFSLIGQIAVEGELNRFKYLYRMKKMIEKFQKHVIVCGYGRLARSVIPDLLEAGKNVVVIDNDPEELEILTEENIPYIDGNAFDDAILKQAGIDRASALLAILPSDADNVYITLSARTLNSSLRILARSEDPAGEAKLKMAGADQVISPFRVSGSRLVQQLLNPYVNDFLQIMTDSSGTHLVLEQVIVPPGSKISGETLESSQIKQKTGVMIAACVDPGGQMILSPDKDTRFTPGSTVVTIGTEESLEKFSNLIREEKEP